MTNPIDLATRVLELHCFTRRQGYVLDGNGVIWLLVYDGGMVTRANDLGVVSAGISWLEQSSGPLTFFTAESVTTAPILARALLEAEKLLDATEEARRGD